jgi:hypothetical protein
VEHCVRVFRSWVLRLKCPRCHRTFTDYPPFRSETQTIRLSHVTRTGEGLFGQPKVVSPGRPRGATVLRL